MKVLTHLEFKKKNFNLLHNYKYDCKSIPIYEKIKTERV